jgi:hypothetical protein
MSSNGRKIADVFHGTKGKVVGYDAAGKIITTSSPADTLKTKVDFNLGLTEYTEKSEDS